MPNWLDIALNSRLGCIDTVVEDNVAGSLYAGQKYRACRVIVSEIYKMEDTGKFFVSILPRLTYGAEKKRFVPKLTAFSPALVPDYCVL